MNKKEIVEYLKDDRKKEGLFKKADSIRKKHCGDKVLLRGIIEFSNHCVRNCLYCGLRRDNKKIRRYRMSESRILDTFRKIYEAGIKTVILQSGDDPGFRTDMLCRLIKTIKSRFPEMAITLSVGERPLNDYKEFKDAGADRYLLKHETANNSLYAKLHPGQSLKQRIGILKYLKKLRFETGAGNIVGLPCQTAEDLADDILLMKKLKLEMAGIGPFIPQKHTPLGRSPSGSTDLTFKVLALARIILPRVNLPATTAVATLDRHGGQLKALNSGANVIMCNFTPLNFRKNYRIYDDKEKTSFKKAMQTIKKAKRSWF